MAEAVKGPSRQPPPGVPERLLHLRACCVLERDADARRRLAAERQASAEDFSTAVARRLHELRSLCDLAHHLRPRPRAGSPRPARHPTSAR